MVFASGSVVTDPAARLTRPNVQLQSAPGQSKETYSLANAHAHVVALSLLASRANIIV